MLLIAEQEHIPLRAAAVRVFGFELDEVAQKLAEAWNMPGCVRVCLDEGRSAATADEKCLASVTMYGHQLTKALYRDAAGLETVHLHSLLNPLGKQSLIVQRDLRRIVDSAIEDTQQTFLALRIPMASLHLAEQAEQARATLAEMQPASTAADRADTEAAISGVAGEIASGAFEIGASILRLLDILTGHAGFDQALFALMSEDRKSIRARLASGAAGEAALRTFQFSLRGGDPALAGAIDRKQDLWVNRKTDARYERSRIASTFDPVEFGLLPVIVDGVVAGLLYAGRRMPADDESREAVHRVRTLIADAIGKKRLV